MKASCNVQVAKGRLALPRPNGHDVLSVARLLIPPLGYVSDPYGNRTHAARVRVSRPAARRTVRLSVGREGIEPLVAHLASFETAALQAAARSTTQSVAREGVEPTSTDF